MISKHIRIYNYNINKIKLSLFLADACDSKWLNFNKRCWFIAGLSDGYLSWQRARAKCQSMNGYLASFHTKDEVQFMKGQVKCTLIYHKKP